MRKSPSKKRSVKRSVKRSRVSKKSVRSVKHLKKRSRFKFSGDVHPIQYLTKEWVDRQFSKYPVSNFVYEELRMRVLYMIAYFIITDNQFIKSKDVKDKAFTRAQFDDVVKTVKYHQHLKEIDNLHAMIETFLEECIIQMKRDCVKKGDDQVDITHGLRWWNDFKDRNGITDELHDEIRQLV